MKNYVGSEITETRLRNAKWPDLKRHGHSLVLLLGCTVAMFLFILTLFIRQEISGETWGYWYFARIFAESGNFIASDRSPLYTLYLNGFRWLGYPTSVTVEHIATSLIMITGIVAMFRSYIGLGLAIFAALLWSPFLQFAEPPVQQLALSSALWGLVVRRSADSRIGMGTSHALFLAAYMFRSSYIVLVLLFVSWDFFRILRDGKWNRATELLTSRRFIVFSILPLAAIASLLIWFSARESDHPWNNPQFSTTTWSPIGNSRSLSDAHFIQAWNWRYIEQEYGSFIDKDWYFTNQELFNGADSMLEAVLANPRFVFELMLSNIHPAITTVAKFTEIRYLPFLRIWDSLLVIAILVALCTAYKNAETRIFIAASIVIIAISVSAIPGTRRHLVALVPLLILCASCAGKLFNSLLDLRSPVLRNKFLWLGVTGIGLALLYYALRATFAPQPGIRTIYAVLVGIGISLPFLFVGLYRPEEASKRFRQRLWLGTLVMLIPLILFSNGISKWTVLAGDVIEDYREGNMHVLESRDLISMKASFEKVHSLLQGCNGVLALEHTFVAAFMDIPSERVYDIWEIPPFGRLGESEYDGLRPSRIDCVLVSDRLPTAIGHATNIQLRYDGYIEPYVKQLKTMGAEVHYVDRFGQIIVLNTPG